MKDCVTCVDIDCALKRKTSWIAYIFVLYFDTLILVLNLTLVLIIFGDDCVLYT